MSDARNGWRDKHREARLTKLATSIANELETRGINACNGDCSEGICCVVIFHGDSPDEWARDVVDNIGGLEEKLLYEGRQIAVVRGRLDDVSPNDDADDVLAQFRTAQDYDTWL